MDNKQQTGWTEGQQQKTEQPPVKQQRGQHELSPAGSGDARTPDKRIGQVVYADHPAAEQELERGESRQSSGASKRDQKSALEGPAAYAPHDEGEKLAKKKS